MSYKLTPEGDIVRLSDMAHLPATFKDGKLHEADPASPGLRALRAWLAEGNIPAPADPRPAPPPVRKSLADQFLEMSDEDKARVKAALAL